MLHDKGHVHTVGMAPSHLSVRRWLCAVPCCGDVCPAGSGMALLAQEHYTTAPTSLIHFHTVFYWLTASFFLFLNYLCFHTLRLFDFLGFVHNILPYSSSSKWMRRQFLFLIINFFFVVVKSLQASNPGWHSIPTATTETHRRARKQTLRIYSGISVTGRVPHSRPSTFQHL